MFEFYINILFGQSWNDGHLTWDPAEYDDIKWIPVKGYEVWVPDILIHNE